MRRNATSQNIFLTLVATFSLGLGSFWYIGVAAPYTDAKWPLALVLVCGPTLLSVLVLLACSKSPIPLRLPAEADDLPLALPLAIASASAYLLLLPSFWALGKLIVSTWSNPQHSEAPVFIALLVLYIPPWWAPLFGSLGAWAWIRHRLTSTSVRGGA